MSHSAFRPIIFVCSRCEAVQQYNPYRPQCKFCEKAFVYKPPSPVAEVVEKVVDRVEVRVEEKIVDRVVYVPKDGAVCGSCGCLPGQVKTLAEMELAAIAHAVQLTAGNKQKAASLLGIGKTTLFRKLRDLKIADAGNPGWEHAAEEDTTDGIAI